MFESKIFKATQKSSKTILGYTVAMMQNYEWRKEMLMSLLLDKYHSSIGKSLYTYKKTIIRRKF